MSQVRKKRVASLSLAAALVLGAGLVAAPASAAPGDLVEIQDDQLRACLNQRITGARDDDAPITEAEILTLTNVSCGAPLAIRDLSGIEAAKKLRTLWFGGGKHDFAATGVLDPLTKLPELATLTINDAGLTDASLATVARAGKLTSLTIDNNPKVTTFEPLRGLTNLTKLSANGARGLADIEALAEMPKLRDLVIARAAAVTSIEPLRGATDLQSLNIDFTGVSDLAPLADKAALQSLSAGSTEIESLRPLAALTKLRTLNVDHTKITSLSGIEAATDLWYLEIGSNPGLGRDLTPIAGKQQLRRLEMSSIGATSFDDLGRLDSLTSLQAMGNSVAHLGQLQAAPAAAATGTFAVTVQRIESPEIQYVPKGAKTFKRNISEDLSNREGAIPAFGGNLAPVWVDQAAGVAEIRVFPAIPQLDYTFADKPGTNDRFDGTVVFPIVWSSITSPNSATVPEGTRGEFAITATEGFPVARCALSEGSGSKPAWLSLDETSCKLSGTAAFEGAAGADRTGFWSFNVSAFDAVGNELTQTLHLWVTEVQNSVVEIAASQSVAAGDAARFTVTRTNHGDANAYTGPLKVRVKHAAVDPADGVPFYGEPSQTEFEWADGDTTSHEFTVATHAVGAGAGAPSAGDAPRSFEVWLEADEGERVDVVGQPTVEVQYPTPNPSTLNFVGDATAVAGDSMVFEVTCVPATTNPWEGALAVDVQTSDLSAVAGTHYTPAAETLTWAPGQCGANPATRVSKEVTVQTDKTQAGAPEREFAIELAPQRGRALDVGGLVVLGERAVATGTITSVEPQATLFTVAGDTTVTVADDTAPDPADDDLVFTIERHNAKQDPWLGETSVGFELSGSAVAGEHYVAPESQTLHWAAGDAKPKELRVRALPTPAGSADRTVTLKLVEPGTHADLGIPAEAVGTISSVVPNPTTFTLSGVREVLAGTAFEVTVHRVNAQSRPWLGDTSVQISSGEQQRTAADIMAGQFYERRSETLNWAAGDTEPKTFVVATKAVPAGDPDREAHVFLHDFGQYAAEEGSDVRATGVIKAAVPEPSTLSITGGGSVDAGGELVFEVLRSDAATLPWEGEARVNVRAVDGTALGGTHFEFAPTTLTWKAGETGAKRVTVQTTAGFAGSAARSFELVLEEPTTHVTLGTSSSAVGTITYRVESGEPTEEPETGGPDTPGKPDGGEQQPQPGAAGPAVAAGGASVSWAAIVGAFIALVSGAWLVAARLAATRRRAHES